VTLEDAFEILDVVDAEDSVVGALERGEIHRKKLFHRSVHVFVVDEAGRIYLQRRSLNKQEHPGKWDSSASGHVGRGESYEEAARRELDEEIGMQASPEPAIRICACEETGMEHSVLFRVQTKGADPAPNPNPQEVLEGRFFTAEEIEARISAEPQAFTPSFRILFRRYREKTLRERD
jgi:isopentenyl-diphosphate Delta-isomerase